MIQLHSMRNRVWNPGDPKPLDNPMVTDKHGRPWRWDHDLMYWVCERRPSHRAMNHEESGGAPSLTGADLYHWIALRRVSDAEVTRFG